MDPLCHTLVGGALARSGLKRGIARATTTLVIAANLPDIDVLAIPFGKNIEVRRGVTHGVLALVLWPFVLAGLMWLWNRWRPTDDANRYRDLVVLSAIGVATHPFLDFLNSYGMRWLMPFVNRWFYGDSLYIVDPILYLTLGGAVIVSWWRGRQRAGGGERPARLGLALATLYIGVMMASTVMARAGVAQAVAATPLAGARFMATAVFGRPWAKEVILDDGQSYHLGDFEFFRTPAIEWYAVVARGLAAGRPPAPSREVEAFLHWARFPVAVPLGEGDRIGVYDLRYARGVPSWAAVEFTATRAETAPPPSPAPPTIPPAPSSLPRSSPN